MPGHFAYWLFRDEFVIEKFHHFAVRLLFDSFLFLWMFSFLEYRIHYEDAYFIGFQRVIIVVE